VSGSSAGARATPYLCPFCGEEDLRPVEPPAGTTAGASAEPRWHCRSCLRLFSLTFHGLVSPEASTVPSTRPAEWSDD
jgi:transposase-like protein